MSIKDLFDHSKNLAKTSLNKLTSSMESETYQVEFLKEQERFIPQVDFSSPDNFVKFGSAEKYYVDSIAHIYNDYPFDGSDKDKLEYHNSSSYLDRYVFEKLYPRYNGYVKFSPAGWGTQITQSDGFGNPSTKEYIVVYGGPNTGSVGTYIGANVYDTGSFRASNLRFGGDYGNTVEFWLKKGPCVTAKSTNEVIFDLWNNVSASHAATSNYGRMIVYLDGDAGAGTSCFKVTYVSGAEDSCTDYTVGSSALTASNVLNDTWNHFAFSFKNVDTSLCVRVFHNGALDSTSTISNASIQEVTGALKACIGSLLTSSGMNHVPPQDVGWGKLSGSIDEFRFWKKERDVTDIGRNWFTQVPGGSNDKYGNVNLGVYYKFNEGITTTSNIDNKVLDYSGRLSHGAFIGYTTNSRSTGSAIYDYYTGSVEEFKDPTIYSTHPDVVSLVSEKTNTGSYYDHTNSTCMYHSMPSWIIEDDEEKEKYNLKNLTQILGQYFDNLYLQISSSVSLGTVNYAGLSSSFKPYPFVNRMLESYGFQTQEIFDNASSLSQLNDRDDNRVFEEKLFEIKNLIYQNIYNNLAYIYKSKGTVNSIRNLVRCFGIDDELIEFNAYANNATYYFDDNYKSVSAKKKLVDFNNADRYGATVYQYTASSNSDSYSYLTSSGLYLEESGSAFTVESDVVFPKKFDSDSDFYFETPFLTSSLFGVHSVKRSAASTYDTSWATNDVANFQVYALREQSDSKNVKFILTGSSGGGFPLLTTSFVSNVYDNGKWTIAVRIKPEKYPLYSRVSGSDSNLYTVSFCGYNTISDSIINGFSISGSMSFSQGSLFVNDSKRLYVGAHRTNFTGSILSNTDIKALGARVWLDYLEDDEVLAHSKDVNNFGVYHPFRNITLSKNSFYGKEIPRIGTLALCWDFESVTGSDVDGRFYVDDVSSGSSDYLSRYGWVSAITKKQLVGRGEGFPASSAKVVDVEYLYSAKQKLPETIDHDGTINILNADDEQFYRDNNPINYVFAVEKSMYQVVSEEILKWFATVIDFNNLIGEPVNRFRQEYKDLAKIRQLFFEKVGNVPEVEKFIEYYKWFDLSLVKMIKQLVPASADMAAHMDNIVESHILERNKYWNKFPLTKHKNSDFPVAAIQGLNKLLVNWKYEHHPLSNEQRDNCSHWKKRELRTDTWLSSSTYYVNTAKELIRNVAYSNVYREYSKPLRAVIEETRQIKGGINFPHNKGKFDIIRVGLEPENSYYEILSSSLAVKDCDDCNDLETVKKRFEVKVNDSKTNDSSKGEQILPFSILSSSVKSGYNVGSSDVGFENMHYDSYLDGEIPMQSPFTERNVGGYPFRHCVVNTGASDTIFNRPEGYRIYRNDANGNWKVYAGDTSGSGEYSIHVRKAKFSRDDLAKRPINVKNIKDQNYSKTHNFFQTTSRKTNNKAFVLSGGFSLAVAESDYISGSSEYEKPARSRHESVWVERFSAPGGPETAGDATGGPGLDIISGEFSTYNSMNFRNLRVREALKTLLSRHCGIFGVDGTMGHTFTGTYETSASFHKTPRNTYRVITSGSSGFVTSSKYDNWFIQHAIPSSDVGYYWITSSATYVPYGYATGSGEIQFVSASVSQSIGYVDSQYVQNFVGFNSASLTASRATDFNLIMNNRNGPYGWPTFKQIRAGEMQMARYNRRNNVVEHMNPEPARKKVNVDGNIDNFKGIRSQNISSYREPPISIKYKSLEHKFIKDDNDEMVIRTAFSNRLNSFGNYELEDKLKTNNKKPTLYSSIYEVYRDPVRLSKSGMKSLEYVKYNETVFPSERYTFLKEIRDRKNFTVDYFKRSRPSRNEIGVNSQGFAVSQSMWCLDGRSNFSVAVSNTGSVGYEGELQNKYTTFFETASEDINLPGSWVKKVIRFGYYYEHLYDGPRGKLQDYNSRVCLGPASTWDSRIGASGQQKISYSVWIMPISSALGASQPLEESLFAIGTGSQMLYLTTGSAAPTSTRRVAFSASWGGPYGQPKQAWITTTAPVTENSWHNIVVTYDKTKMPATPSDAVNIYVNGSLKGCYVSVYDGGAVEQNGPGGVFLGNDGLESGSHTRPFEGYMSNFAIFDDVLTAAQVAELYNGGFPKSLYEYSKRDNLISWYLLGDGVGTITASWQSKDLTDKIDEIGTRMVPERMWDRYGGRGRNSSKLRVCNTASVFYDSFNSKVGDASAQIATIAATPTNVIFDMAGRSNAIPNIFVNGTSSYYIVGNQEEYTHTLRIPSKVVENKVSALYPSRLIGNSQYRRPNWSNNFKVGAMYSRPELEYVSSSWPRYTVQALQGDRQFHKTGSRIFVGDTDWSVATETNKVPMENDYSDFASEVNPVSKEYGVVPEFRISEHMDYYLNSKAGNFLAENPTYLTLTGGYYETSDQDGFYRTLSEGEYLNQFDTIVKDHSGLADAKGISITCRAVIKMLPYEGFYPAQRTLQLAQLFSQSYGDHVSVYSYGGASASTASWRAFLTPAFAPGIIYNSIKSGIATDYPIYTVTPETKEDVRAGSGYVDFVYNGYDDPETAWKHSTGSVGFRVLYGSSINAATSSWISRYDNLPMSLDTASYSTLGTLAGTNFSPLERDDMAEWRTCLSTPFSTRVPFEAMVEPENYLSKKPIYDMEPDHSASLLLDPMDYTTNQAAYWSGVGKSNFKLAMHNFLASSIKFFLKEGKMTTFASGLIPSSGVVINEANANTYFGMDVTIYNGQCKSLSDWSVRRGLSEFASYTSDYNPNVTDANINSIKGIHTSMYSRDSAFGPPWVYDDSAFTSMENGLSYHYGYEPFTPAYFNGYGTARIIFYPYKGAGTYTIDDIHNHLKVYYFRMPTNRIKTGAVRNISNILEWSVLANQDVNLQNSGIIASGSGVVNPYDAAKAVLSGTGNWMQLSASVNLFGKTKVKKSIYQKGVDEYYSVSSVLDDTQNPEYVWSIQPKWETVVQNFINSSPTTPMYGSGSVSKGMWHQYGSDITASEGIWLQVADVPGTLFSSKGQTTKGELSGSAWPWFNRAENVYNDGNVNAEAIIYIRDHSRLSGAALNIDSQDVSYNSDYPSGYYGWVPANDNYNTALSIANVINSLDMYGPAGQLSRGLIPTCFERGGHTYCYGGTDTVSRTKVIRLDQKFTASVFIPSDTEGHPWVGTLTSSVNNPVAAVKIKVIDTATESTYYPNFYASGKLGNRLPISMSYSASAWMVKGTDPNSGDLIYGNDVKFCGGQTSEYTIASLADLMGFQKEAKRIGEAEQEQRVKEAVVAIPYREGSGFKEFFKIPRRKIEIALGNIEPAEGEVVGDSIRSMVKKLENYVIPPKFDFINIDTIDPIVMIVFEFGYVFKRQDLIDIWQNVRPEIANKVELQEQTVSFKLGQDELFNGKFENVKWLVFKLKQKGNWNYFSTTADSSDDDRFKFNFRVGRRGSSKKGDLPYSYNWPYDYFSLVERCRMDVGVMLEGVEAEGTIEIDDDNNMVMRSTDTKRG